MITRLRIENFKCYEDHTIVFRSPTIIVGKNNAGKSTLIDALRLISIALNKYQTLNYIRPPAWAERRGGIYNGISPSIRDYDFNFERPFYRYGKGPAIIELWFSNGSFVRLFLDAQETVFVNLFGPNDVPITSRHAAGKVKIPSIGILPQIGPLIPWERLHDRAYIRNKMFTALTSLHFRNQLLHFSNDFEAFKNIAERTWKSIQIEPPELYEIDSQKMIRLYVREDDFVCEIGALGHGIQMWLQTMWFLSRSYESKTLILDEPDVYMHPDLQHRLVQVMSEWKYQLICATHSTEIMSEVSSENILVIDRVKDHSDFASSNEDVQSILANIGSVSNLSLTRFWHTQRFIIVEGGDLDILDEFYKGAGMSRNESLKLIPNGRIDGWGGWERAMGIKIGLKNAIGEPVQIYCILDADYHTDEERNSRYNEAEKRGISLHIWNFKEIENYLLVPSAVNRIIESQIGESAGVSEEIIAQRISDIAESLRDDLFDKLAEEIRKFDRKNQEKANTRARNIIKNHETKFGNITRLVSGKAVLSRLSHFCQENWKVSLNAGLLARSILINEIDPEFRNVVQAIANSEPFYD